MACVSENNVCPQCTTRLLPNSVLTLSATSPFVVYIYSSICNIVNPGYYYIYHKNYTHIFSLSLNALYVQGKLLNRVIFFIVIVTMK